MRIDSHRWSVLLIATSLVLLAGFLVLFLKKTWQDEVLALKKETGFLFVNSIRGIEGTLMDRLLTHDIRGEGDSVVERLTFRLPDPPHGDSLRRGTIVTKEKVRFEKQDTNVRIRMAATPIRGEETEVAGSLSLIVAMTSQDERGDSVHIAMDRQEILPLLDSNFSAAMRNSKLPVGYRVVQVKNDMPDSSNLFRAGSYMDLSSGESYAAQLSDYRGHIFREMLPEMLFSLALFGCVSLAFFTVLKNLQAQRRLTALKNDFIQNVTHELKTPIATVGVAIEALRNFDAMHDPARTKEYLDISTRELSRLSLLVDKVLHMSLFEDTMLVSHFEPLDFKGVVNEVVDSMKLQFERQGTILRYEASGDNFWLRGDRLHLTSVVFNLLDNALKYSSVRPEIDVRLHSAGNEIRLEVADNGIGIAPEHRERIFEKFYRVPTGSIHNVKGHGLGLSFVASVVAQHGGRIQLGNGEVAGTVFLITLPIG